MLRVFHIFNVFFFFFLEYAAPELKVKFKLLRNPIKIPLFLYFYPYIYYNYSYVYEDAYVKKKNSSHHARIKNAN